MTQNRDETHPALDGFLDGDLGPEAWRRVEEHLASCDRCADELAGMRTLGERASALPREIAPPRDLWPEIAARLQRERESDREVPVLAVEFGRSGRTPARVWAIRIAAGLALVFGSSALTARLLRGPDGAPPVAARPEPTSGLASFASTEAQYLSSVEALAAELESRRDQLPPSTVATVEENLLIIDRAIAEARAALAEHPQSAEIPLLLSGAYRQKVDLLRSAVSISART